MHALILNSHIASIDMSAAGHGWFVDETLSLNDEHHSLSDELVAN